MTVTPRGLATVLALLLGLSRPAWADDAFAAIRADDLAALRAIVDADRGALSISCGPCRADGSPWDYDAEYELGPAGEAARAPHDSKDA